MNSGFDTQTEANSKNMPVAIISFIKISSQNPQLPGFELPAVVVVCEDDYMDCKMYKM